MNTLKKIKILALPFLALFLCSCEIKYDFTLPGNISGSVQDAYTGDPVQEAEVRLFYTNDSTEAHTTGMDGTFLFTNLEPAEYGIEVSANKYESHSGNLIVSSTTTTDTVIELQGKPKAEYSAPWLNFGFESTQLSFSIQNTGEGILSYDLIPTQDWISVFPESGEIFKETEIIEVNIQKEGLQEVSHQAWIAIHSDILGETEIDSIDVYLNYVMDVDSILYKTVRIGSQVWMAENLNTGKMVDDSGEEFPTLNNGIDEKLCYNNDPLNCETFGGLYMWEEAMDYALADTGSIQITQGVCPDGWHIPSTMEWETLIELLGADLAGGMLKDTSPLWQPPNEGASNETGFTALPAGAFYSSTYLGSGEFRDLGAYTWFWSTWRDAEFWKVFRLSHSDSELKVRWWNRNALYPNALSVRCIKDP